MQKKECVQVQISGEVWESESIYKTGIRRRHWFHVGRQSQGIGNDGQDANYQRTIFRQQTTCLGRWCANRTGEPTPIRLTCFTQTVFVALLSIPLPLYVSLSLPTLEAQISLSAKPATAPMQEELAGSTHVFFDGCVLQDHSAAAAFVVS
ncbi:hypothetical protein MRX96_052105 [Rhipicephalus microplus]